MSEVFVFKQIKAKNLNHEQMRRKLYSLVEAEGKVHQAKLRPTVSTWRHRPSFTSEVSISGGNLTVITGPTGDSFAVQLFVWTDKGTRPHQITARRAPTLKFRQNYSPKTRPGEFTSYPSGSYGDWQSPYSVRHPGTEARGWTEELTEKRASKFQKRAEEAIKKGAYDLF